MPDKSLLARRLFSRVRAQGTADILAENLITKAAFEVEALFKDSQERLLNKGRALSVFTLSPNTLAQNRFTVHQCWVAEDGLTIHLVTFDWAGFRIFESDSL